MPGPTARTSPSLALLTLDSGSKTPPAVYPSEIVMKLKYEVYYATLA